MTKNTLGAIVALNSNKENTTTVSAGEPEPCSHKIKPSKTDNYIFINNDYPGIKKLKEIELKGGQ